LCSSPVSMFVALWQGQGQGQGLELEQGCCMHRYLGKVDPMHWLLTLSHYPNPKCWKRRVVFTAATMAVCGCIGIDDVYVVSDEMLRPLKASKTVFWSSSCEITSLNAHMGRSDHKPSG